MCPPDWNGNAVKEWKGNSACVTLKPFVTHLHLVSCIYQVSSPTPVIPSLLVFYEHQTCSHLKACVLAIAVPSTQSTLSFGVSVFQVFAHFSPSQWGLPWLSHLTLSLLSFFNMHSSPPNILFINTYWGCLVFVVLSPLRHVTFIRAGNFVSLLYPMYLDQCPAHSEGSISVCWLDYTSFLN